MVCLGMSYSAYAVPLNKSVIWEDDKKATHTMLNLNSEGYVPKFGLPLPMSPMFACCTNTKTNHKAMHGLV